MHVEEGDDMRRERMRPDYILDKIRDLGRRRLTRKKFSDRFRADKIRGGLPEGIGNLLLAGHSRSPRLRLAPSYPSLLSLAIAWAFFKSALPDPRRGISPTWRRFSFLRSEERRVGKECRSR